MIYSLHVNAQDPTTRFRSTSGGGKSGDSSLKHRSSTDDDSITISFRYLDSSRLKKIDSSVYDFRKKFPLPWYYNDLGNSGTAAENLNFYAYNKIRLG